MPPPWVTGPVLSLPLRRVRLDTIHVSVSPTLLSPEPLTGVISVKRSSREHLQPLPLWHSYHWQDSRCAHVGILSRSCWHQQLTFALPCWAPFYCLVPELLYLHYAHRRGCHLTVTLWECFLSLFVYLLCLLYKPLDTLISFRIKDKVCLSIYVSGLV